MFLSTVALVVSIFLHKTAQSENYRYTLLYNSPSDSTQTLKTKLGNKSRSVSDSTLFNDTSMAIVTDTLNNNDTLDFNTGSEIEDMIEYKAADSMVYDMGTKKMYLYNEGDVAYQKIKLKANLIDFDWNTYTLEAEGTIDSAGLPAGRPVFKDGDSEYRAKRMAYNFKTKKGIVYEVVTQEGEAYIHSEKVKRNENNEWFGQGAKYTTCDLDHPHFYFKSRRVKIVPDKVMVTGPASLWVADVPLPLGVPFGLFPVKQGRRSGLVMPEYGQDAVLGFLLRNGGYYWAVNDYLSLKFTGQISTNGTWGAGVASNYALRYKFTGNLAFYYLRSRPQDPDLPNQKASNAFSFSWSHNQDPKSIPNSTFGAMVQMQSADFYNASRITDQRLLNTSFNSTVNFTRVFPRTPFSLAVNMRHEQNLLNRQIGFTLPTVRLSMSRVAPFKSRIQTGKPKWYEGIGFTYNFEFSNVIQTFDSILFQRQSLDKFRFGINQNFQVDAPITLFKYLILNPSFNYQERTYFKGVDRRWNSDTLFVNRPDGGVDTVYGRLVTDTVWRFNSARNFNTAISLTTKLIGIYKFKNKYIKAIKHVFTPSVSFNYQPDFSRPIWRYYRNVQTNANGRTELLPVFEPQPIYGIPGAGAQGTLAFSLFNNFEMKTYSKKDTVNNEQKVGLLDQVNLTGGYNFIADSMRLQPFNLSMVSSRIFNLINLNFNAVFDPYTVDSLNRRINTFEWEKNRRLLRFSSANISASTSFRSKPRSGNSSNTPPPPAFMADYVSYNPNQLYDFDIPWSVNLAYRFNLTRGTAFNPDTLITVQSISVSADFNLTAHWKIAVNTGFDITNLTPTLTNISVVRDLHCWELSFAWTPPLPRFPNQQFTILLHPKSGTLKDLKVQRRNLGQGF